MGGTPRGLEKVLETYQKVAFLMVRNSADQDAEIELPGGVQIWPRRELPGSFPAGGAGASRQLNSELADANSELADANSEFADATSEFAGANSEFADANSEFADAP